MIRSIIFGLLLVATHHLSASPHKSKFLCRPRLDGIDLTVKLPQPEAKVIHPDTLFYYQFEDFEVREATNNRFQITANLATTPALFESAEKRADSGQMQISLVQQDLDGKELARKQFTKPLGKEFTVTLDTQGKKVKKYSLTCEPISSTEAEELDITQALEAESRYRKRAKKSKAAPVQLSKKYENVVEWAFQHIQALPDASKRGKFTKELTTRVSSLKGEGLQPPLMSSVGQAAYSDGDVNLILAYVKLRSLEDSIPRYEGMMQDGVGNVRDIIEHDKTDLLEVAVMLEALKQKPIHADLRAWHKKLDTAYVAQTKKIDLSRFPKEEVVTIE